MAKTVKVDKDKVNAARAAGEQVAIDGRILGKRDVIPDECKECISVRDSFGRLTQDGMRMVIRQGGSVMLGGESYTDEDSLPDQEACEALWAREAEARAQGYDAAIADLQKQKAAQVSFTGLSKPDREEVKPPERQEPPAFVQASREPPANTVKEQQEGGAKAPEGEKKHAHAHAQHAHAQQKAPEKK